MEMDLIQIKGLKTYFFQSKGLLSKLFGPGLKIVHAVDGVSLTVKKGHTFGLVGESGCGKSTLGETILRLVEPLEGNILYKGQDVFRMDQAGLRAFRRKAQLIFQDQFGCLNPRMTAGQIIAEPIMIHETDNLGKEDINLKVAELLEAVNLDAEEAAKFPHEFSGGQARRIGVARAIALNPDCIIADEPTSGLDISTAATVLNLMQDLQERLGLTYLWISHNLNQVQYMSDDIAIMYLGKIVEITGSDELYANPLHPYTVALLSAVPIPDPVVDRTRERIILTGDVPSPINPPSGCNFHPRCQHKMDICSEETPQLRNIGGEHWVACHLIK